MVYVHYYLWTSDFSGPVVETLKVLLSVVFFILQVTIVDPLTITQEFSNIVANPTIATNVTVKIVLHNNL